MITSLFNSSLVSLLKMPLAELALMDPIRWIPIVLPLAGIALGAIAIIGGLVITDRNRKMRHETIRLALEKGQSIPENLLRDDEHGRRNRTRPRNDRRTGLILIAVGVGVFLFFHYAGGEEGQWLGAIPGLIGVALLINWLFERNQTPPPASRN